MSKEEELQNAISRLSSFNNKTMDGPLRSDYKWGWVDRDRKLIANAYVTELAERQQRIKEAANAIEGIVVSLLLGNGVDMRKHRIVIAKELLAIITRHLDGETT